MTDGHSTFAHHGGRLGAAARRYPDAPRPWLDLSTGINPVPWAPVAAIPIDQAALPSPEALAALVVAAATAFDAPDLPVTALPGSEIGLRLVRFLDLPHPWRIVTPAYRSHSAALPGAETLAVDAVADVRDGTLLLANPNNPDGRLIARDDLLALARRIGAAGGMLVVDEAFADADPGASVLPSLAVCDRVLVFRSFGKFFGLAGVRLGFACGHAATVAAMAELLGSWPVSAAAIALGMAAYADAGWIGATRLALTRRAAALDTVLAGHGLVGRGACPMFRLIETPDALALFERLARAGILARPFDYAPDWLRIGVPADAAGRARLDRALRGG